MLRAVIFDFNGIIVDDEPIHFELFRRVFAEEGIDLSKDSPEQLKMDRLVVDDDAVEVENNRA